MSTDRKFVVLTPIDPLKTFRSDDEIIADARALCKNNIERVLGVTPDLLEKERTYIRENHGKARTGGEFNITGFASTEHMSPDISKATRHPLSLYPTSIDYAEIFTFTKPSPIGRGRLNPILHLADIGPFEFDLYSRKYGYYHRKLYSRYGLSINKVRKLSNRRAKLLFNKYSAK